MGDWTDDYPFLGDVVRMGRDVSDLWAEARADGCAMQLAGAVALALLAMWALCALAAM